MKKDRKNEDRWKKIEKIKIGGGKNDYPCVHSGQTTWAGKDGRTGELMTVKLNILTFAFAVDWKQGLRDLS